MAWYDRIIGRSVKKRTTLELWQDTLDSNQLRKEARTPVYSAAQSQAAFQDTILPPVDQAYLEELADRYSHLRTVVSRIASQSVAKGWTYVAYDKGDPEERLLVDKVLRDPSNGHADINGHEFIKAMIRQVEVFDDCFVSVVFDYVKGNGIEGRQVKELWVEDAKQMRFNVDELGRFRDDEFFDIISREFVNGPPKGKKDWRIQPMAYYYDAQQNKIPFARDEVIHFNKYSASARLYGQSPIIGLMRKIETALAIESFQNKIYKLERPPKGFLDIPGHDEESLNRLGEYIAEETRRNPNFIPIISSREGRQTAKFVSVMPNMDELMALPYMERINNDINAAYGVMPIITGNIQGVGGLNSEGEQISIFDRTIRETQKTLEDGFFRPLLDLMEIKTWTIVFKDINERNEQQHLANMLQKANIITVLNKVGIKATLDSEGNLKLPAETEVVIPEGEKAEAPRMSSLKP